jgi:prevent-host-death family protein
MKTASVASLKSRLSHYLRMVRRGGEVVITFHRQPVGKIVPYAAPGVEELRVIPPRRPWRVLRGLKGVTPLRPVDVVAVLREDRDAR